MKKIIAIDLDGVLNLYNGSYSENEIPLMRTGADEFLAHLSKDYRIEIFTARSKKITLKWLQENGLSEYVCNITDIKNPRTSIFIDDRAIKFTGDFQDTLKQIEEFTPHWYLSGKN